jgi:hypothetical protein
MNKVRVLLNAVYRNGDVLKQDFPVPAQAAVREIVGAEKYRELCLRMVVTPDVAEELLEEGLCRGVTALSIEQIPSLAEREVV